MAVGTHPIKVTVKPGYGSTATACDEQSVAKNIVVIANPIITVAPDITSLCEGGYVELTATITNSNPLYNSGNHLYTWMENGAQISGTQRIIRHNMNDAGTYVYSASLEVQNNRYGCASPVSVNSAAVTVVPQPIVTITDAIGLLDICVGGSISLTATIINANQVYGNLNYYWYYNKNLEAGPTTSNTHTQTINRAGTYDYYAVATPQGRGCKPAESNIISYNVVNKPTWASVVVTPLELCEGGTVTLSAVVQGGVRDASGNANGIIQWVVDHSTGNFVNVMGGVGGNTYDNPDVGTHLYKPTYTTNNFGDACTLSDPTPVQVTVSGRPTAEFISGDSSIVCGGDVNSYADLVVRFTGVPPFSFTLVGSDGTVQNMKSYSHTYTISVSPDKTTYYYIASLTDNSGCEAFTNTLPVAVFVSHIENVSNLVTTCGELVSGQNPTAKVYFEILTMAPGRVPQAMITFLATGDTAWYPIETEGNLNYVEFETPIDPGDYQMLLTIDGCEYPFTLRVMISNNGNSPLVLQRWDDVVVVNNNPDNNGGYTFTSYQWYRDGELIQGATGQYYQELGGLSGNYSVMLVGTDANGKPVQFMTCEAYFAGRSIMSVMPNPSQPFQMITIQTGLTEEELSGAVLDIYTVLGQHLKRVNINSNTIRIEGFAVPGTYVGKITTGTQEVKSVKIVVVK